MSQDVIQKNPVQIFTYMYWLDVYENFPDSIPEKSFRTCSMGVTKGRSTTSVNCPYFPQTLSNFPHHNIQQMLIFVVWNVWTCLWKVRTAYGS